LHLFGGLVPFFGTIAWIGVITALLAAVQATVQREIKKVLAYSTVSQIGYMMLGLGVAGLGTTFLLDGYTAGLFHVMSHAVFKASMFLAAGWVLHVAQSRFMDEMGGLSKALRFTSISMFIAGFSLMGIPPLSGFWTKDQILFTSFAAGQYLLYALALVTVLLTGYYTMRMLGMTFSGKPSTHMQEMIEHGHHPHEASLVILIPYLLLAVASAAIGALFLFIRDPLTNYLSQTASLPATTRVETGASPIPGMSLEVLLTIISVVVAGTGAAIGYLRYFGRSSPFNMHMIGVQKIVFERFYLNALYYKVFVNGMMAAAGGLYRYVELNVWDRLNRIVPKRLYEYSEANAKLDSRLVDKGFVDGIAASGSRFSDLLKRLQTGVTQQYVLGFAIGIFLLLLYMLFIIGGS
ncbi:MAG TPA: proton-conducting transporter membrane subunit, partial [Candidatus Binatus sp.]|nr:proton-conducting transporter membrane subunit [Candidatus Binatus sp.]